MEGTNVSHRDILILANNKFRILWQFIIKIESETPPDLTPVSQLTLLLSSQDDPQLAGLSTPGYCQLLYTPSSRIKAELATVKDACCYEVKASKRWVWGKMYNLSHTKSHSTSEPDPRGPLADGHKFYLVKASEAG